MEIKIKNIYVIIIAVALLVGTFFVSRRPLLIQTREQMEMISYLQNELLARDSVIAGEQKQITNDSIVIGTMSKEIGELRRTLSDKKSQIVHLRYSVAELSDSITFILTNVIDCPECEPELPALYLPFIFKSYSPQINVDGYFDEEACLTLKIKARDAIDTVIYIPEKR